MATTVPMPRTLAQPLALREYDSIAYYDLDESTVRELERLTDRLGVPLFRFYRDRLQARQYVGVVKLGNRTIQILPKIFPRAPENLSFLVFLLGYARRLALRPTAPAQFSELNGSFLEVWIRNFALELNHLLNHHMQRRYVEVEADVAYLRGKLLVHAMQSGREEFTGRYPCRYEVFTTDHLLNQALKFCNRLLRPASSVASTQAVLRENGALLDDVADRVVRVADLDRIHLNRLNRRYEPILDLCRLLLRSATLDLRAGRISQLAFVFDMNVLFEEFVAEFLGRHASRIRLGDGTPLLRVEPQYHVGSLFGEFAMWVDVLLVAEDGRRILLDTKYKVLDAEVSHDGLSQADFYQMFAYARAGKQDYDEIILLYPEANVTPRTYRSGGVRLHVSTLELRNVFDSERGALDENGALEAFQRALAIIT